MNMNRRKFLGTAASSIALGLAGCTASADCGEVAVDGASHTVYAAPQKIFIDADPGGFDDDATPHAIPDRKLTLVKKAIGAGQEFTPVTKAHDLDPDGYGPYTGFYVHEDTNIDWVREAFENAGLDVNYDWWKWSDAGVNWGTLDRKVQQRYEAVQDFSASDHSDVKLPRVEIRPTNSGEEGERAIWTVYDAASTQEAQDIINVVNKPTGLAVSPRNPRYTTHYDIVTPSVFIEDVDVVANGSGDSTIFEVQATLNQDAVDTFVQNAPAGMDEIRFDTASTFSLMHSLLVEDSGEPKATVGTEYWADAYAIAASFVSDIKNPVYMNGDVASCAEETTSDNSTSN